MVYRITHQIWFVYLMDNRSPRQEGNNSNGIALDKAKLFTPHDDDDDDDDNACPCPSSSSTI
jgi:hypothetical protein